MDTAHNIPINAKLDAAGEMRVRRRMAATFIRDGYRDLIERPPSLRFDMLATTSFRAIGAATRGLYHGAA